MAGARMATAGGAGTAAQGGAPIEAQDAGPAALSDKDIIKLLGRGKIGFQQSQAFSKPGQAAPSPGFKRRDFGSPRIGQTTAARLEGAHTRDAPEPSGASPHGAPAEIERPGSLIGPQDAAPSGPNPGFSPQPPPAPLDIEAEKQAAREEGRADAMAEIEAAKDAARQEALETARQEADRSVSDARDVFLAAAARLEAATADAESRLLDTIQTAVASLASDRAGVEIDSFTPSFIARMERLARLVASECKGAVVHMHPADLGAIQPYLGELTLLAEAQLIAGEGLSRGDLKLQLGDIDFEDALAKPALPGREPEAAR